MWKIREYDKLYNYKKEGVCQGIDLFSGFKSNGIFLVCGQATLAAPHDPNPY